MVAVMTDRFRSVAGQHGSTRQILSARGFCGVQFPTADYDSSRSMRADKRFIFRLAR
jgi:hypothetical protein